MAISTFFFLKILRALGIGSKKSFFLVTEWLKFCHINNNKKKPLILTPAMFHQK
jgi:hypothetical protein